MPKEGKIVGDSVSRRVWIDFKEIDPAKSQSYRNHSPDGFNWGYGGSGPAQLALAILLEVMGEQQCDEAQNLYQGFKHEVISTLPQGLDFELPIEIVKAWVNRNAEI